MARQVTISMRYCPSILNIYCVRKTTPVKIIYFGNFLGNPYNYLLIVNRARDEHSRRLVSFSLIEMLLKNQPAVKKLA